MMALVEVSWEGPDGSRHSAIRARMEDTSRSGACIRVNTAIGVGVTVWVKRPWEEIAGVTKYCRRDGMDYVLGIQRILEWRERNIPLVAAAPAEVHAGSARLVTKEETQSVPKGYEVPTSSFRKSPILEIPPVPPSPDKERKPMSTNWLGMAFKRQKEEPPNGKTDSGFASDGSTSDENILIGKPAMNSGANGVARSQGDLQSLEDIYRAAGILNPRMGYSISKVVEMIRSDHMRGLASDAKRAAILMALDAASISVEEVLRDAALRRDALDAYEAGQRNSFEEYWARKAEVNLQIQAETDRIVAQNLERIQRNRDEVAREKAEFAKWQAIKNQEVQRIGEAVELCSKAPSSSAAGDSIGAPGPATAGSRQA
jgi:hypothetical protein